MQTGSIPRNINPNLESVDLFSPQGGWLCFNSSNMQNLSVLPERSNIQRVIADRRMGMSERHLGQETIMEAVTKKRRLCAYEDVPNTSYAAESRVMETMGPFAHPVPILHDPHTASDLSSFEFTSNLIASYHLDRIQTAQDCNFQLLRSFEKLRQGHAAVAALGSLGYFQPALRRTDPVQHSRSHAAALAAFTRSTQSATSFPQKAPYAPATIAFHRSKTTIAAHEQLILGSLVSPGPPRLHYPAGAPPLLPPLQLQALLSPTQQTIQALQPSSSFAAPACRMSGGRDYGGDCGSGGTVLPAVCFLGGQKSLQVSFHPALP